MIRALLCGWLGFCPPIAGPAYVQDGDTIYVGGQSIRLWGIDAEELYEPAGLPSKYHLVYLIAREEVTCTPTGDLSHYRMVATCSTLRHKDLGRAQVLAGAALDCKHYSLGVYRNDEPADARTKLKQKPYC